MNLVVVRGRMAAEASWSTTRTGTVLCTFDLHVGAGRDRTVVPVTWSDPPAAAAARLSVGDELVVRGRVAKRFISGPGGVRARTDVLADQVVPARRARQAGRLMLAAATALHST
jgi:hypothetical protein